jgi:hypothetical protein
MTRGRYSGIVRASAIHAAADASDGMRQSPRGDNEPPDFGEFGTQSRWGASDERAYITICS